jgi:hypothetical protein
VRAREDMHIAAKSDHHVAGLSCRTWSHPQNTAPQPLHTPTTPGYDVLSCRWERGFGVAVAVERAYQVAMTVTRRAWARWRMWPALVCRVPAPGESPRRW